MFVTNVYNDLGSVYDNIDTIINKIEKNLILWEEDTSRQDKFGVHKDTKAIILRNSTYNHPVIYHNEKRFEEFIELILPALQKANEFYKYKYFDVYRILIAKLKPGGVISKHRDSGTLFNLSHRVHWAIKTNKNVVFTNTGIVLPFENGKIIEISNLNKHDVVNNSNEDRIHIIFDCYNNTENKISILKENK